MRIIYVCDEYPPIKHGGIGSFTRLMAGKMTELGHSVLVIGYGDKEKDTEENINGVKIICIKKFQFSKIVVFNALLNVIKRLKFFNRLRKQKHLFKPDIIELYDWSGPLIFPIKGVITLARLHDSHTAFCWYMGNKVSKLVYFFEKRTLNSVQFICSVSDFVANITENSFNKKWKTTTIYNGVDTDIFKPLQITRDVNRILLVGRMHPAKGFEELFNALNIVFKKNENVYLEVICTIIDNYKQKLLSYIDEPYRNRIHFLGRIPNENLPQYYNRANILVLPSRAEAFPIIPLESMACGTPVIMSNRFSSEEIIDDGENGFLVDIYDKERFASKILEVISNQVIIDNMRSKVVNKIKNQFDIEKIIQRNIDYYNSLINRNETV